ncbi:HPr-rel-A system PqqD family peptide chaperone [Massilia sp.]|uniref:HPr-rel-A system PqqD family peptide chaperone n=1 Tax=Massilia sp. TaxID=1882437 RepID=UPI00391B4B24
MLQSDVVGQAWRLMRGQALAYRRWDDETVLYNDLSGATHLLGQAALCVLEALRHGPTATTALASRLCAEFDIDGEVLEDELKTLLGELAHLSLIEPCPC